MKRLAILLYGIVVYFIFFGTFLYLIGFTGNLVVPKSIDGPLELPLWQAILINVLLIAIFCVQHSVMARSWFKEWWTKFIPAPVERSTYVLFTVLALITLFTFWQPMGGTAWSVENSFLSGAMMAVFALGWVIVLTSTFLINHFDLFGLRQVWLYFRNQPYEQLEFTVPIYYKWVRHPIYLGFLIAFWAAPIMSMTRLFFAIVFTIYTLKAIRWEEKDLLTRFGEAYRQYAEKVPKIVPSFSSKKRKKSVYETIMKTE